MLSREDHPYRLRRIDLRNFKSVLDESVELGPLTVVVGANSSGKSTLLQAVLAVAQTVQIASSSNEFPLNGQYLNLGTYGEARNFRTSDQSEPMTIGVKMACEINHGFDLEPSDASQDDFRELSTEEWFAALPTVPFNAGDAPLGPDFVDLDWSLDLGASPNPQSGFAKIQRVEFSAMFSFLDERERRSVVTMESGLLDLFEDAEIGGQEPIRKFSRRSAGTPVQTNKESRITNRLTSHDCVEESVIEFDALELTGGLPKNVFAWRSRTDEEGTDRETLIRGRGWIFDVLDAIQFATQDLFGATVHTEFKYLGPLREPPRTRHDRGSTGRYLGNNGEYAAVVLNDCADLSVNVPLPDGHVRQVKLGRALDEWIQWLELADGASVEDYGRHGLALKVRREGTTTEVDLTSVGVGVSQVLPVILMCLLSDSGDMLIFEQPELHLHPATQQRMADLLLAFAAAGRQILIETHSEHLVNRLRTQVASDDTDRVASLIKLLFAEQTEGITSYRESAINEYGGVSEDWPEGFFDISAKSAQDLVRAHLNKRQRAQDSS